MRDTLNMSALLHMLCCHVNMCCRGPAVIIPLGDPLMTLTDTIFIGQVVCWHMCTASLGAVHFI
jgi:hypothetical protein